MRGDIAVDGSMNWWTDVGDGDYRRIEFEREGERVSFICESCGCVHASAQEVCVECGAKMGSLSSKGSVRGITQAAVGYQNVANAVNGASAQMLYGQITIRSDDGDIQIEPFQVPDTDGVLAQFRNTAQRFVVSRKPGHIVDIAMSAAGSATQIIAFIVNGRHTGVSMRQEGIAPTINNRMPFSLPIVAGAAIQLKAVS